MTSRVNRHRNLLLRLQLGVVALVLLSLLVLGGCGASKNVDSWQFWNSGQRAADAERDTVAPIVVTLAVDDLEAQLRLIDFEYYEQSAIVRLSQIAPIFYQRLSHRRVNSIATFHDPALREFFRSPEAFADYYADLVQALDHEHFRANRPTAVGIESFAVEEGGERVIVRVRFRGDNGLPMRFWSVDYTREDTWERSGQSWWIVPRKL